MLSEIEGCIKKDINNLLGDGAKASFSFNTDLFTIRVLPGNLIEVLKLLRDNKIYNFKILIDVFGVDYPSRQKRFEINYNLLSVGRNLRINIKTEVADREDVPSVVGLFSTAEWFEREVWDMYGVKFKGNSDLRRILTDYGFEGHPLRKDFPLTGYKEVRYDFEKKKVVYEDVSLTQEFRRFDFESPWKGMERKVMDDMENKK